MIESHTMFRPPAEAYSLLLRVANGCPWNRCRFCGMYKGVRYDALPREEWMADLAEQSVVDPAARRVFLADGDVMHLPTESLLDILNAVNNALPQLARVGSYANGASILKHSEVQLRQLRELKLHTLYMGLESGDDGVLRAADKRETGAEMLEAALRAQAAGLRMSVMVLIGLGGRSRYDAHVRHTVDILNRMKPRQLSFLRMIPVPNTPIGKEWDCGERDDFLSEREAVMQMRDLIDGLTECTSVLTANHVSNVVPIEGRLPKDRGRLTGMLDAVLSSDRLTSEGPGAFPLSL
ncbi:MAG: radical SAM protein [Kiritimatiellae bacterium]|nr:radical SAM protein [Kiritimatiellia bacterium]